MRTKSTYSQNGTSSLAYTGPRGKNLKFVGDNLEVALQDGRVLRVPLDWYPRLERATREQRLHFRWIGNGIGINWPDIDEHISVEGLLKGIKAPRSVAYLTSRWPEHLVRERKRIEDLHKKLAANNRSSKALRRTSAQRGTTL